ncbi:hypothetical protein, partial [Aquabacterium sp.]|uniref:hypothetical protein n=1 Tax=Aquabacterium sp. TaxID=1872578 RepID=UPI003783E55D
MQGQRSQVSWIARTRRSQIGHAQRSADGTPILLKVGTGDASDFREEHALLQALQVPGLLHPLELSTSGALPAMVCADLPVTGL